MTLHDLEQQFDTIWEHKFQFVAVFMFIVTLSYGVLFAIDFIPEAPTEDAEGEVATEEETEPSEIEETPVVEEEPVVPVSADTTPDKIIIDALDREVIILNPESSSIAALDTALLSGIARHPDSADLLENGTMLLFGHSSYLPNVINKNFQAFNGIQKLEWGDTIRIQSADFEYVYRVDKVYEAKASTAEVAIASDGKKLTLVTCDSFGSKEDRFIVEASLIDSFPLE